MGGGGSGRGGGSGWGVRVDVNEELKILRKLTKKIWGGGGSGGGSGWWGGVRVDVTEPGLEPTTSGLEKPALLSTRLNTIIAITKYE